MTVSCTMCVWLCASPCITYYASLTYIHCYSIFISYYFSTSYQCSIPPLQVLDKYHPPDYYLPESYTCFFLLKIPRYSCKPVLEEKLCYAINFCKSIDTDDYAHVNLQEGMMMGEEDDDIV